MRPYFEPSFDRGGHYVTQARVAHAVLRMLDECSDPRARDHFIDAVRRFEGWTMDDDEVWRRIRQACRARSPHLAGRRHFDGDWALIAVRVVAFYGGADLIGDLVADARAEGRRERDARKIHKVERARQGRRTA